MDAGASQHSQATVDQLTTQAFATMARVNCKVVDISPAAIVTGQDRTNNDTL